MFSIDTPLDELHHQRNKYSYPAVGLEGTVDVFSEVSFPSIVTMETEIGSKLRGGAITARLMGYFSVLFWGHYGSADGMLKPRFALRKVTFARDGYQRHSRLGVQTIAGVSHLGREQCAAWIADCANLLDAGKVGARYWLPASYPR